MRLVTCNGYKSGAGMGHPCAKAVNALTEAGHPFEHETVGGNKLMPWTRNAETRKVPLELTGKKDVPILVLDDGTTITSGKAIVAWAESNRPA